MKTVTIILFTVFSVLAQAQSIEPLDSPKVKLRVLDSFSGPTSQHGEIVYDITSIFYVPINLTSVLSYRVEISTDDVFRVYQDSELAQISKEQKVPKNLASYAMNTSNFLDGLEKAGQDGVKVVNYSVATLLDFPNAFEYQTIVSILEKYKMILVVPTGNQGVYANRYPCSYKHPQIVCVAAGTQSYVMKGYLGTGIVLESYSNVSDSVTFIADGSYNGFAYGTSYAAPRVASALAFLWGYHQDRSPVEIINMLKKQGTFVDTAVVGSTLAKNNFLISLK